MEMGFYGLEQIQQKKSNHQKQIEQEATRYYE